VLGDDAEDLAFDQILNTVVDVIKRRIGINTGRLGEHVGGSRRAHWLLSDTPQASGSGAEGMHTILVLGDDKCVAADDAGGRIWVTNKSHGLVKLAQLWP
jgi:hypothetical protein